MDNKPAKIIVHHTAVSGQGNQFNGVNESHKKRQFPVSSLGFYCGYHFLIEKDGTSKCSRKISEEGVHTKGQNLTSIGIALAGNFDIEVPTEAQKGSLGTLCYGLMKSHKISLIEIVPHRKYANTSCYGKKLNDDWAQLIVMAEESNIIKKILLWLKIQYGKI